MWSELPEIGNTVKYVKLYTFFHTFFHMFVSWLWGIVNICHKFCFRRRFIVLSVRHTLCFTVDLFYGLLYSRNRFLKAGKLNISFYFLDPSWFLGFLFLRSSFYRLVVYVNTMNVYLFALSFVSELTFRACVRTLSIRLFNNRVYHSLNTLYWIVDF